MPDHVSTLRCKSCTLREFCQSPASCSAGMHPVPNPPSDPAAQPAPRAFAVGIGAVLLIVFAAACQSFL